MVLAPNKKVAIVCDWLIGGGAELVVEELHKMFPEAPIYTSYCTDEWRERLDQQVATGWLQRLGRIRKFLPPLRVYWFSRLDMAGYDLVISVSGAEAKFVKIRPGTLHIAYINAPTHYYWSRYDEYLARPGFGIFDWLARIGLKLLVGPLRQKDYQAAQRPDHLIANSTHIQKEIKKYYDRESTVIHPPVDVDYFISNKPTKRAGFVIAGRQTPYKRIDLAITACNDLELPLTVIGDGPDHQRLVKMSGSTVTFSTNATKADIAHSFQRAKGFIFPGLEDFGIVAVEALAAGTPVIAYEGGGSLDYIKAPKNGLVFEEQTVESLSETLKTFEVIDWDNKVVSQTAENFAAEVFCKKISNFVREKLAE